MARTYECSNCLHTQVVGIIENGRAGFADPHTPCENCGEKGQFHYAPGWHEKYTPNLVEKIRGRLPG